MANSSGNEGSALVPCAGGGAPTIVLKDVHLLAAQLCFLVHHQM